jgi:hypothetical protein
MIKKLQPEDIQYLNIMKETGRHRDHNSFRKGMSVNQKVLWKVLTQYCQMKGIKSFHARSFRKEHLLSCKHAIPRANEDCPLSKGELYNAIKYGVKKGKLQKTGFKSNIRWVLNGGEKDASYDHVLPHVQTTEDLDELRPGDLHL